MRLAAGRTNKVDCSVDGCTNLARGTKYGFCKLHYDRWRRHGDPTICLKAKSPFGEPRAWINRHTDYTGDECLTWPFARHKKDGRAHMYRERPCRLMCTLAHGPAPSRTHQAAHSCGKGHEACINPRHLRWATPLENSADKFIHGTISNSVSVVLTVADVREIRSLKGIERNIDLARRFGVSDGHIANILSGEKWRAA